MLSKEERASLNKLILSELWKACQARDQAQAARDSIADHESVIRQAQADADFHLGQAFTAMRQFAHDLDQLEKEREENSRHQEIE